VLCGRVGVDYGGEVLGMVWGEVVAMVFVVS